MIQKISAAVAKRVAIPPITIPAIAPPPSPSFFGCGSSVGVTIIIVVDEEDDTEDEVVVAVMVGMTREPPSLPVMLNATPTVNPGAAAHP